MHIEQGAVQQGRYQTGAHFQIIWLFLGSGRRNLLLQLLKCVKINVTIKKPGVYTDIRLGCLLHLLLYKSMNKSVHCNLWRQDLLSNYTEYLKQKSFILASKATPPIMYRVNFNFKNIILTHALFSHFHYSLRHRIFQIKI